MVLDKELTDRCDRIIRIAVRSYMAKNAAMSFDDAYQEAWLRLLLFVKKHGVERVRETPGIAYWRGKVGARAELSFANVWPHPRSTHKQGIRMVELQPEHATTIRRNSTARIELEKVPTDVLERLGRVLVVQETQIDVYCSTYKSQVVGSRKSKGARDFRADLKTARRALGATSVKENSVHGMRSRLSKRRKTEAK